MKSFTKYIGHRFVMSMLVVMSFVMCITVNSFADSDAEESVSASISCEEVQSAIDGYAVYNVYLDNASYVSTIIFNMEIKGVSDKGTMAISENECFDVCSSEWSRSADTATLKGYLGRAGMKLGFSGDDKIKVATILIPVQKDSEHSAEITGAECAGIVGEEFITKRGTAYINGGIRGIAITSLTSEKAVIETEATCNASVILAAYKSGVLKDVKISDTKLKSRKNEFSLSELDTAGADEVKVMVFESITSLLPLCESNSITIK